MGVSGQGVQAKDESESKYPGIEAQVAGQVGEKDSATLQGNPSETYKEVNLNILGQLCNECLPSDLYPQTCLQPGAWLSAVNHPLSPLLLPPNLLPQGQNPSRGPLEVGRLMFSALIRNGDPGSRIER